MTTWTERIEQYLREGRTVSGAHHGKTGQQKQGETIANQDFANQSKDTGTARGTLSQFEGPVQQSPFYKSLLTSGIESTSNAYDNAAANQRQRANAAGFGYNQPVAQGADNQLRAREAESMAALPREAALATAPLAMEAGRTSGTMGLTEGELGGKMLNSVYGMQKGRSGLWNQLFGAGVNAATGLGEAALSG